MENIIKLITYLLFDFEYNSEHNILEAKLDFWTQPSKANTGHFELV